MEAKPIFHKISSMRLIVNRDLIKNKVFCGFLIIKSVTLKNKIKTHIHTNTQTRKNTHSYTNTQKYTLVHKHAKIHTHTQTCKNTHSYTNMQKYTQTRRIHSYTSTQKNTFTHKHAKIRTHTQTHTIICPPPHTHLQNIGFKILLQKVKTNIASNFSNVVIESG